MITNLKTNRHFSGYVPVDAHPLLQVAFATANSAFRKAALEELKGFDERCGTGEDIDLSIRLSRSGWKLYFKPNAVVYHKHRHTLEKLLKQWFDYGFHHPYLFKKHSKKRLEVFVYKRRKREGEPYGVKHLFGAPFPIHAAVHLSDFYYMHALLGLFLASLFPLGPNPVSGLSLAGASYFCARHFLSDFELDDPKRSLTYVLLRYLLNVTYLSGGFIGGIRNSVLFLDLPRENNPNLKHTSFSCSDLGPGDERESSWLRGLAGARGIPIRGVCYDTGTNYNPSLGGLLLRQKTKRTAADLKGDFKTIKDELCCNAIRILGDSVEALVSSAELALEKGLIALVSPRFIDATVRQAAVRTARLARSLEELRKKHDPGRLILLVANEAALDLKGILPGDRIEDRRRRGVVTKFQLNKSLKEIVIAARSNFKGLISYSALPSDAVNWRMFDIICVNLYMNENNLSRYADILRNIARESRPVFVTEFGFTTNDKALGLGELGYTAVDWSVKRVKDTIRRDEKLQARLLADNLEVLRKTNVKGAFVYSFAEWRKTHRDLPSKDLDTASFGVMMADRNGRLSPKPSALLLGKCYQIMKSEQKESS